MCYRALLYYIPREQTEGPSLPSHDALVERLATMEVGDVAITPSFQRTMPMTMAEPDNCVVAIGSPDGS